jgi:AraC family transcriptional regulator
MILYIKNMVCNRCILVVKKELEELQLNPGRVSLGEVEITKGISEEQLARLGKSLINLGFELLDNQNQQQIEKVKSLIIQKVQGGEIQEHFVLSEYLGSLLHRDYGSVSRLFSEVEGITIEQFYILQKIEKVKEWLVYGEFRISEIAWKLGYSSVAHLSAQFKKVTGLTPSHFRKPDQRKRKTLDNIK